MDRTERFYKIDQLLSERRIVPFTVLEETLGVSRATIKRDLEYLRNRLHAPIVWDRELRGYCFETAPQSGNAQYELPGLWFNASEIHALLTMQHLLAGIDSGGLLASHIEPLKTRLRALLDTEEGASDEIQKRIKVIGMASRPPGLEHFAVVGSALLRRKRLLMSYFTRGRGQMTEREVSPQRLVHYRENWYLDAWCHLRNELRSFAVDAIQRVELVDVPAKNIGQKSLDAVLGAGYGIFSGRKVSWARLRFTAERARWVSMERWHPRQKGHFLEDGSYVLDIPYSDMRELTADILRYGADVVIESPDELRQAVRLKLEGALQNYL